MSNNSKHRKDNPCSGVTHLLPAVKVNEAAFLKFRGLAGSMGHSVSHGLRLYVESGGTKPLEPAPPKQSCDKCLHVSTCGVAMAYRKVPGSWPKNPLVEAWLVKSWPGIARAVGDKCGNFKKVIVS